MKGKGRRQKVEGIPLEEWVVPRVAKAKPSDYPDEPYLGLDDIEAQTTRLIGSKSAGEMKSSAKRFYPGDVLYSRLRPYLNKVWLADRSGLCSAEFIVLPSNDHIDGAFLKYRLNARDFVSFANSLNAGDRPRVDFDQISAFCLPPFALARQRRIVSKLEELFSELEAGESALKKARHQLGVYRQSLLKQAFEGKLTAPWRAQHSEATEPRLTTLEELVTIQSGNGFPKRFQGEEEGDFPFFKVGDISKNAQAGRRRLGRAGNYISETVRNEIRGKLIPPDATVFAKIGAAVALNRRALTSQPSLIDNNAMALIPGEELDPDFLYLFMRQVDLGEKTRGGAVPSLRKGDIEEIPILLPSLPEQQEIVRLLDEQFEVIEQNEREIDAALKRSEALRQSILKKAFTGHLVPQDPTDEPASTLLERIREEREASVTEKPKKKATRPTGGRAGKRKTPSRK